MDPSESPDPIFIVDLNEVQEDGYRLPVSMDYTLNLGARVLSSQLRHPNIGQWVKIHSDEDDSLLYAQVDHKISDRDYIVRVDWNSCEPVLNDSWSARAYPNNVLTNQSYTVGSITI
jgi:hypothetical protein